MLHFRPGEVKLAKKKASCSNELAGLDVLWVRGV
jgi:hypothetical protein